MKRYCATDERDKDLYDAYRNVLKGVSGDATLDEILYLTVKHPARRFYVSERVAYNLVKAAINGEGVKPQASDERKRIVRDIMYLVGCELLEHPDDPLYDIVSRVIDSPAPEFYIKPSSANVILHYEKKRQKEIRKQNPKRYLRSY